jgi:hypothetical protein
VARTLGRTIEGIDVPEGDAVVDGAIDVVTFVGIWGTPSGPMTHHPGWPPGPGLRVSQGWAQAVLIGTVTDEFVGLHRKGMVAVLVSLVALPFGEVMSTIQSTHLSNYIEAFLRCM